MFRFEPYYQHNIGAIQERGEARLYRHGVDVLDPSRNALDL
jgi:hypothetical protein